MMTKLILLLSVILNILIQIDASNWRYDGDLGPKHWQHLFPDGCSGTKQSPIDIKTTETRFDSRLNDFAIWYDPPRPDSTFHVINNGHTIQVNVFGPFHVANGGLPSLYSTAQFHFHWGHANHQGSEHLINGKASPLELHVVNYDSENYKHIGEAMVQPQGLAVLGVMYEAGEEDNLALEPIIKALEVVKDPDEDMQKDIPAQRIRNFLPEDTTKYFRYNGSLTTPGCFESVIWTVFHEPQHISHRQLREFRRLLQNKRHEKHHKRSTKEEKIVEEVLTEAGIEDSPLDKLELQAELEKLQGEVVPKEAPIGEQSGTHHGTETVMTGHNETSHIGEPPYHVETEVEKQLENKEHMLAEKIEHLEKEIERMYLVNNFRPVQPLHGRTVYRSFPDFSSSQAADPAKQEIRENDDDPNNHSTQIISSWTVLLLSVCLTLFR